MADKQRRMDTKIRSSPPSSPLMPPAPNQSRNREAAAPGPYSDNKTPRARLHERPNTTRVQAPPDPADAHELLARAVVPVAGTKMETVRRFLVRLFFVYLAYTLVLVCPSLQPRSSNAICDGAGRLVDWLVPYKDIAIHQADETYRTYAEPYVQQYGQPLYQQGHKYYMEVTHPVVTSATDKIKTSYHQHAHPHVQNAIHKTGAYIYTDKVKAHVNQAHEAVHACQKRAHDGIGHVKHLHSVHVQPVIDKVTSHAQTAWHHASSSTMKGYDACSEWYMKQVNPYVQRTLTVVLNAADDFRSWCVKHTDEMFGNGRTARHAAEKARKAERRAHEAAKKAHAESLKDKLLKKAQMVEQPVADEAEYLKKQTGEKVHEAGKISENIKDTVVEKAHEAREAIARQADYLRQVAQEQVERVREAGAYVVDSMTGAPHHAKEAFSHEAEHMAKLAKEKKENLERLAKQEAAALKLAALKSEEEAKNAAEQVAAKIRDVYGTAERLAENIIAKVVETGKGAEKAADEKVKTVKKAAQDHVENAEEMAKESFDSVRTSADQIVMSGKEQVKGAKKAAQDHVENAEEMAKESFDSVRTSADQIVKSGKEKVDKAQEYAAQKIKGAEKAADEKVKTVKKAAQGHVENAEEMAKESFDSVRTSADQIVMSGKEKVDKAQGYAAQKIKDAGEQADHVKDDMKHKAHDATTASKASLAAMLAGIEASFGKFYEYEDTETKALWSKLQNAIDDHVEAAKKSSQDLEKANREAYEAFQSYVRDWRNQGGDLEDRLSKLSHTSVDSIKKIGLKADEERAAAMSRAQTLSNNVEVYLSGLREFLSDRLSASMATAASELDVFKGTSNEDDHKTVRDKLEELEKSARSKLESAGSEAHTKAKQLMKQAEDIQADAEVKLREYAQRTRQLASEARDEVKGKVQSVQGGSGGDPENMKGLPEGGPAGLITDEAEPQVRIAAEEPGSGHRHHRHY
ncbi:MAG: hypothetical protein J3Q66DRAFT_334862 [Benniella sp.]|nr:MAG: hypothetical protein J3Q66DRAFT_334862 [Benniella sp.]